MRGLPYYEEESYHKYLLSRERKDLFTPEKILSQIQWSGVENLLDFGMGNGFFLPYLLKKLSGSGQIWGAECQELLIDYTLHVKVKDNLERFIPFYIERNEHPLLPEWLPPMDAIFCSCVLSTFADPSLALQGISRILKPGGRIIVLDWERVDSPSGPEMGQKVSSDRMLYFIEDAGLLVSNRLTINPYLYGMELIMGEKRKSDPMRAGSMS